MPVNAVNYMVKLIPLHPQILPISLPPSNFHFLLLASTNTHTHMSDEIANEWSSRTTALRLETACASSKFSIKGKWIFRVWRRRRRLEREFHLDIPALSLSRYIRAHHLSLGTILICGISIFSTGLALILGHFIMRTPLGTWMVIKWMAILDERRCWF